MDIGEIERIWEIEPIEAPVEAPTEEPECEPAPA